jgi:dimeric dUTPase (all-alpha-NTP-PPase superfamily)
MSQHTNQHTNQHQYSDQLGFLRVTFHKQLELNEKIGHDLLIIKSDIVKRERFTKEYILAAIDELFEVLHETNWKIWKQQKKEITEEDIKKIQEELVDVFHFFINLCILWDMTPDILEEVYLHKNAINHKRQDAGY